MPAPDSAPEPDPYAALVAIAEEELALVRAERVSELAELNERRSQVLAQLPPVPPAEARPALERVAALQADITTALTVTRDHVASELVRLDHGRRSLRGYAPARPRPRSVDRSG